MNSIIDEVIANIVLSKSHRVSSAYIEDRAIYNKKSKNVSELIESLNKKINDVKLPIVEIVEVERDETLF